VNVPINEIPDAFKLSAAEFKEKYSFDLPSPDAKNIVLTCRSGGRILTARKHMEPLGYKNLRLYSGSFMDWKINGGESITETHIYDARSPVMREVYGYPTNSEVIKKPILENIKTGQNLSKIALLVDDIDGEPLCTPKIKCYADAMEGLKAEINFPTQVSFQALKKLLDLKRVVLIDVRRPDELSTVGKIPGSVNVPINEIPDAFKLSAAEFKEKYSFDLPSPDAKNIVLTCRSGGRILTARKHMEPLGYKNLRLYSGSFMDWKIHGGESI